MRVSGLATIAVIAAVVGPTAALARTAAPVVAQAQGGMLTTAYAPAAPDARAQEQRKKKRRIAGFVMLANGALAAGILAASNGGTASPE